jgi:hypothetical protein
MDPGINNSSVVIVGNGASLLTVKNGSFIDSHDVVARFNLFNVKDFAEFAGTKTTVWFSNRDAEPPPVIARLRQHVFERIYVHTWQNTERAAASFQRQLERLNRATPVEAVDKRIIRDMTSFLGHNYSMFSTGAIGVWVMLQRYRFVTLIGFDWWHAYEKFHYCDRATFCTDMARGHQPQLEKVFFQKLQLQRRLAIHGQEEVE